MKPWEETWEDDVVEIAAHVAYTPERRRLASAAPDMARVLLDVEWMFSERDEYRRCPSCTGLETTKDEPRTGHYESCKLDAALRKAGVR
jgi:hypothetical protein